MSHNNLNFKIDTKEKMHVIRFERTDLAANMTENYRNSLLPYLREPVKNLVLDFSNIQSIDKVFAQEMVNLQQEFYGNDASMVFCNFSEKIKDFLDKNDFLDAMNYAPTESEAWDIVQMEEIERELF